MMIRCVAILVVSQLMVAVIQKQNATHRSVQVFLMVPRRAILLTYQVNMVGMTYTENVFSFIVQTHAIGIYVIIQI